MADSGVERRIDGVLLIAFGGPEKMEDVRPFLANVLRGRSVPADRLESVVQHYELIGGRSPMNELTMRQADALQAELDLRGSRRPVYVGMRNWPPLLEEVMREMLEDGVQRVVGVILSAQQSEAGWERYRSDCEEARQRIGATAPEVVYAPEWHAHPGFIETMGQRVAFALGRIAPERRSHVIFTAHSIPLSAAEQSPYVEQVKECAALVADRVGHRDWTIAYQSRSGSPQDAWLEPDIRDAIRHAAEQAKRDVVVVPIGFVCDHIEVLYDLDIEARRVAVECGVNMVRAETANDHPAFIEMLADIVEDEIEAEANRA